MLFSILRGMKIFIFFTTETKPQPKIIVIRMDWIFDAQHNSGS